MYKLLYLFMMLLLAGIAYSQEDTSKVKFKPGTLVGKYYGTYDTTAKKPDETPKTKLITSRQFVDSTKLNPVNGTQITGRPQIVANQNFNPIEISGTQQAGKLDVQSGTPQSAVKVNNLTDKPELRINQNFNPIEVSGTEQVSHLDVSSPQASLPNNPQQLTGQPTVQRRAQVSPPVSVNDQGGKSNQIYRDTRLGSSSPQYDTYEKNQDGAGSVTTAVKSRNAGSTTTPIITSAESPARKEKIYRPTRLGSSSPQYDTYEKNDYGAGAVTTMPKSRNAGSSMPAEVNTSAGANSSRSAIYRDTRLGSSSPLYDSYKKNNDGAGSVTTNPNKRGGSSMPVTVEPIKPEQSQSDTSSKEKTEETNPETRDK